MLEKNTAVGGRKRIRVLVVDDSAVVRRFLVEELSRHNDMEVVGTAVDPYIARERIFECNPDVLTLDLEMPRMNGLEFLVRLMKFHPMPVVVVSAFTPENSKKAVEALNLGAVEVIGKPGSPYLPCSDPDALATAIRAAAAARVKGCLRRGGKSEKKPPKSRSFKRNLVAIGASTGGTQAVEQILTELPVEVPGLLVVQHMPPLFTRSFAERLNDVTSLAVREAEEGDRVLPGTALVAPGGIHMILERQGAEYATRLKQGPRVRFQRPSVDVLFQSVARVAKDDAVGVILTGMGKDGARGLLHMRRRGACTLAQDEASCTVFGMPREAIQVEAVGHIVPLDGMAGAILEALEGLDYAR